MCLLFGNKDENTPWCVLILQKSPQGHPNIKKKTCGKKENTLPCQVKLIFVFIKIRRQFTNKNILSVFPFVFINFLVVT